MYIFTLLVSRQNFGNHTGNGRFPAGNGRRLGWKRMALDFNVVPLPLGRARGIYCAPLRERLVPAVGVQKSN